MPMWKPITQRPSGSISCSRMAQLCHAASTWPTTQHLILTIACWKCSSAFFQSMNCSVKPLFICTLALRQQTCAMVPSASVALEDHLTGKVHASPPRTCRAASNSRSSSCQSAFRVTVRAVKKHNRRASRTAVALACHRWVLCWLLGAAPVGAWLLKRWSSAARGCASKMQ